MKRISKFGVVLICLVVVLLLPTILSTTASGPMIAMPVFVSQSGRKLSPHEIKSIQFIFSEKSTSELMSLPLPELRDAKKADWGFLIDAPFSIVREGLQFPKVNPRLQSVYVRVAIADGKPESFCFPVFSTADRNSPIFIDLAE